MKNHILALLLLGIISGLYADGQKSITIKHRGETDKLMDVMIFDSKWHGKIEDIYDGLTYHYYHVEDFFFNEIIDLLNKNSILFDRTLIEYDIGCFELHIEIEGISYYYYLNKRESSLLFFNKLVELLIMSRDYYGYAPGFESIVDKLEPGEYR